MFSTSLQRAAERNTKMVALEIFLKLFWNGSQAQNCLTVRFISL